MLNDITFGQFFPCSSPIHKMDARVKLILTVAFIALIFVSQNFAALLCTAVGLFIYVMLTNVPVRMYIKSLKPLIIIVGITSILNLLYVKSGQELFAFDIFGWNLSVTLGGVTTAIYMTLRVCLLVIAGSVLTYTTSATELTDAIERVLSPLNLIKIDVHSFAMMMTIALRFIPTLIEETDKIMSAQKARGADLESGGIRSRLKALIPILIPLLVSSFRRALELADAMECRCYHGGEGRTRVKQMKLAFRDYFAIVCFVMLIGAVIISNIYLEGIIYALITVII